MPVIRHEHRTANGMHMFLGANPRARDPREDKYHFRRLSLSEQVAHLDQEVGLDNVNGIDSRIPITDQKRLGACVAFSVEEGTQMAQRALGQHPTDVHPGWIYENCRKVDGTWPQDAGTYGATGLDLALKGLPRLDLAPYNGTDAAATYDDPKFEADRPNQIYVASHRPFYVNDGNVLENLWLALAAGLPVLVGMAWLNNFFNPHGGVLPKGENHADVAGGHEVVGTKWIPNVGLMFPNHWTTQWSADASSFGHGLRPGEAIIPIEYLTASDILWEYRVLVPTNAVVPQPNPDPTPPNPDPTPSDWKSQALPVIDSDIATLQNEYNSSPHSIKAKYRLQGGQHVRSAVAGS